MSRVIQFYHWLRMLFVIVDPPAISADPPPSAEDIPRIPHAAPKPEIEETGEFYFRHAILDQLDTYFEVLSRMKKADRQAYDLYSKIGVNLIPRYKENSVDLTQVTPWWKTNRPSIGAVAYADLSYVTGFEARRIVDGKPTVMLPRFFFFQKFDRSNMPTDIERPRIAGDIYTCTVYWDDGKKHGMPWEYGVVLGQNGMIQVLKSKASTRRIHSKISNKRNHMMRGAPRIIEVPCFDWEHHAAFKGWAAEHKQPVEEFLTETFIEAINTYEASQLSMIRVDVNKEGLHGAFGVNILRTPYFFKDRELTVNHNGRKKRIFHIVRGHVRASGAMVKTHFRGLRDFAWNGYAIKITVPIRDHQPVEAFTGAAHDKEASDAAGDRTPTVPVSRLASVMRQVLDGKRPTLH